MCQVAKTVAGAVKRLNFITGKQIQIVKQSGSRGTQAMNKRAKHSKTRFRNQGTNQKKGANWTKPE